MKTADDFNEEAMIANGMECRTLAALIATARSKLSKANSSARHGRARHARLYMIEAAEVLSKAAPYHQGPKEPQ